MVTPKQKERLVEFFGKEGAEVVISHIDDLEGAFGSASVIIRRIMEDN